MARQATKEQTKRIYAVNGPDGSRLIRATSVQQAISFASKGTYKGSLATQEALIAAGASGAKVEEAVEAREPADEPSAAAA